MLFMNIKKKNSAKLVVDFIIVLNVAIMGFSFVRLFHLPESHIGGFHPGTQRQVPSVVLHVPPSQPSPHASVHCTP